jgi:hypothetical protein
VNGVKRVLAHLDMLDPAAYENKSCNTIYIEKSGWIRASAPDYYMIKHHWQLRKKELFWLSSDPFGKFERKIKSPNDGYIINANLYCLPGDAIYHISKTLENKS